MSEAKIELRYQKISDAKRFFTILNNPNFKYFTVHPKSIKEEIEFLRKNKEKIKNNIDHNYAILYNGEVVGGCWIMINQHRKHIADIGYFLDEKYWWKGITTKAVKILENIAFEKLGIKRIQILMLPKNRASEKVAIKCGYEKEGIMRKSIKMGDEFLDTYLYAKVSK